MELLRFSEREHAQSLGRRQAGKQEGGRGGGETLLEQGRKRQGTPGGAPTCHLLSPSQGVLSPEGQLSQVSPSPARSPEQD